MRKWSKSVIFTGQSTPYIKWVHKRSENITMLHNNGTILNTTTTTSIPRNKQKNYDAKAEIAVIVPKMNKITYMEDGVKHVVSDLKFEQAASSTLVLKDLSLMNGGVYTCVMSNSKGVTRQSTYLIVNPGTVLPTK